jgi:hypothetical protein
MADDLENFRERQDGLEARVGTLEATVEEQARLRAAMDEDMGNLKAELGAHKRLIKAIRATQSDHTKRLTKLETGLDELRQEVRTGFGRVQVGVEAIRDMLDRSLGSDS